MMDNKAYPEELTDLLKQQVSTFNQNLIVRPAVPIDIPEYSPTLLSEGKELTELISEFNNDIEPWLSSSNGSRYLGFVTGGAHWSAVLGDWITTLYDQNVVTKLDSIASSVETSVCDMLLELFNLPKRYSGTFVTGATMANFSGLACARQWVGEFYGRDVAEDGLGDVKFRVYSSGAHSSIHKALAMLGIGRSKIELIETVPGTEECDMAALEKSLEENRDIPVIFCASAGTVNYVSFDDFHRLTQLKKEYTNLWIHTDAAFGLFTALLDGNKKTEGIECSDSITVDCHKWLNTPYDAAVTFVRSKRLQVEVFKNVAPYLNSPDPETADFLHLAPENSRRFRALPVWFVLRSMGRLGVKDMIKASCSNAEYFSERLSSLSDIKVMNSEIVNVVCFNVNGHNSSKRTKSLLSEMNRSGISFMTPTVIVGIFCIRAAFTNCKTSKIDVDAISNFIGQLEY
jgi:glutamate/tyrosine decarboxylase-like PLP-dependent enzyme